MWWLVIFLLLISLIGILAPVFPLSDRRLRTAQQLFVYGLMIAIAALSSVILGPVLGLLFALVCMVVAVTIAQLPFVFKGAQKLMHRYRERWAKRVEHFTLLDSFSGAHGVSEYLGDISYDQIRDIIKGARVLTSPEKQLMGEAIGIHNRTIRDYIRPISQIQMVDVADSIGPLLLDELHQSRYKVYPVMDKETVVGSITFSTLMNKHVRSSVADLSDQNIMTVRSDDKILASVESMFEQQTLLAVVADADEPSVVMLQDLVSSILGKKSS